MPLGVGGIIRYSINCISHPDFKGCLENQKLIAAMTEDIGTLARKGLMEGEFVSSFVVRDHKFELMMVAFGGTYSIEPDFEMFCRIMLWSYDHCYSEAITREGFIETFGQKEGDYYHAKWEESGKDLARMTAYFKDRDGGQKFIGMVMGLVREYEIREDNEIDDHRYYEIY